MRKIIFFISLLLISLSTVFAYDLTDTFYYDYKLPNMYVTKIKDGKLKNTATFMLHRSNSDFVYCIDPFTSPIDGIYHGYIGYNFNFNLTQEQVNRLNLIAYYGYGYMEHTDLKWYGITQYLIWKNLNLDDIYYTDSYYGEKVELYVDEINELNKLVDDHFIIPNFNSETFDFSINETYILTDQNSVLDSYDISYDDNIEVQKEGNNLVISSKNKGSYEITLTKKSKVDNDYIFYENESSQNLFYPGRYDDINTSLIVNFYDGQINIHKRRKQELLVNGEETFEGAIYGLYDNNDILIKKISLDKDGLGILDNLSLGEYYIKEIEASKGYLLDDSKYYINLTVENNRLDLDVFEDIIKNNIKIIKMFGNDITNNYSLESDVSFKLFDSNNNYIDTYITDENGEINLILPYGKYQLIQINGIDGYTVSEPIIINVEEDNYYNEITIKDKEKIKFGNLTITKKDEDGNLLDGVKFNLYALEDIISLSGDIYYHKDDLITQITINNGIGYLGDLYYGKYYLVETETQQGYLLDESPIEININDENIFIETINYHYDIPNTGKNEINLLYFISKIMIYLGIMITIYEIKIFNNN